MRFDPTADTVHDLRPAGRAVPILLVLAACGAAIACGAGQRASAPVAPEGYPLLETTIDELESAMVAGRLTAHQLVQRYLDRIEAYDKRGPALNSLIRVNPHALERADELDARMSSSGPVGPLHGIPVIVKDNYDTGDMPTSAGSASLADSVPPDDAFQVRRLRAAGAIVLAKSNMAEFAFSPYETIGSAIPGYSRNPYALNRVTAGSSGGTAAAVAANLGAVGLGTDTGNSIRGPSSHQMLVGIRSSMGLTSRDGIVPLYLDHDIGGPIARTVADAVRLFDVIAGYDPADPVTAASQEDRADGTPRRAASYLEYLDGERLQGARIGVVRQLSETDTTDPEVHTVFETALADMLAAGAAVVDIEIPELDEIPRNERWCRRFRYDLEAYLATLGDAAPYRTLTQIIESGKYHQSVAAGLRAFNAVQSAPQDDAACQKAWANGRKLGAGVRRVLRDNRLDAVVYPTWSNPPRLIGDLRSPAGDNSQDLSPHTGFPAITVPMGFTRIVADDADRPYAGPGLPAGITFLAAKWQEPTLIGLAYSYEQATRQRRPPSSTPALPGRR